MASPLLECIDLAGAKGVLVLISAASLPWPGTLDPWYRLNEHRLARLIAMPLAAAWVPEAFVRRTIDGIFAPGPFSFSGEHYVLEGLDALPKPVQQPLPLILGGAAKPRGAALT